MATTDDDKLDFLLDANDHGPQHAAALEEFRTQIAAWSAQALINRFPEVAPYRHVKGILTCQQDLDMHLRHLYQAVASGDLESMATYARWIREVLAQRGMSAADIDKGVGVLAEGLYRHLELDTGSLLGSYLADSFGLHLPESLASRCDRAVDPCP